MSDPTDTVTEKGSSRSSDAAYAELKRQLAHYENQKNTWTYWYYGTKVAMLTLGASIPVMTTFDAWSWTIAVAGGLIAVVEGISQVWHFHDRYVAARALHRGLDKERILFESSAGDYSGGDDQKRNEILGQRIFALFDTYESQVLSAFKASAAAGATGTD